MTDCPTPYRDPINTVLILVAGCIIAASGFVTGTIASPAPQRAAAFVGR